MSGRVDGDGLAVGDEVELAIGPVAHGGVCVARIGGDGGRVVFVRHALPGERVVVRLTEVRRGSFCRGDAVRVLRADEQRVDPACAHFRPGGCGGCDWMHAAPELQRRLKAAVVAEQFARLAGERVDVMVEALPGDGYGWRSSVRWAVGAAGPIDDVVAGPRRHRSREVVPVNTAAPCLIAAPGLASALAGSVPARGADEVVLALDEDGPAAVTWLRRGRPAGATGRDAVTRQAAGRSFRVAAAGFWQGHVAAAGVLADAVSAALAGLDVAGRTAWDLYGGVGLFAPALAAAVGEQGAVVTVESDRRAAALAGRNLADLPQVRAVCARVDDFVARAQADGDAPHAVVLDPPRSGAGAGVCTRLAGLRPARIVYVACDPAALARDTAALSRAGYRRTGLRAFDAFPHTHHVECVAVFEPSSGPGRDVIDGSSPRSGRDITGAALTVPPTTPPSRPDGR